MQEFAAEYPYVLTVLAFLAGAVFTGGVLAMLLGRAERVRRETWDFASGALVEIMTRAQQGPKKPEE